MKKIKNGEQAIAAIFIISIFLNFYYGFKYSAGFEYASKIDIIIITILTLNIYGGILYFLYRFIKWIVVSIVKIIKKYNAKD